MQLFKKGSYSPHNSSGAITNFKVQQDIWIGGDKILTSTVALQLNALSFCKHAEDIVSKHCVNFGATLAGLY